MTTPPLPLPPPAPDRVATAAHPVHEPPVVDERKTRRRSLFYDRIKILVILTVVFGFLVVKLKADIPIMTWGEAARQTAQDYWWLFLIGGLELLRQLHYVVAERSAAYNTFWDSHVWGAWERRVSRMNPWRRFRINRLFRFSVFTVIGVLILGQLWGTSFIDTLTQAPSRLWGIAFGPLQGMPALLYILFFIGMAVIQFVAIFWFMSKGGVDTYMPEEIKTRFSDVWGQDHVLEKVKENIMFLDNPEAIEARGGHVPGGMLLWGPPGTGKTLMAEAVAGETGKPYVFVDPGAFQNMFFGVGILKVKSLYRKLRKLSLKYGGVIVFFDEADSLGNRGQLSPGGFQPGSTARRAEAGFHSHAGCNGLHYVNERTAARLQADAWGLRAADASGEPRGIMMAPTGGGGMGTLQALLTEMSGLKKPRGFLNRRLRQFLGIKPKQPPKYRILTMMATNMPSALDEALLRPGRIDRIYKVGYPSLDGRVRTFEGYLNKIRHDLTPEQIERLALMSPRASGAVIKDIVNESLIVAMGKGRDTVSWPDVIQARVFKVHGAPDGQSYSSLERHQVAIHEASHAVAMFVLQKRQAIDVATIEQRGDVGGFVSPVPIEERKFDWRSENEDDIVTFLVSLAGERMFFDGDNSVGVGGDLRNATTILRGMMAFAGMGATVTSHGGTEIGPELQNRFNDQLERRLQELLDRSTSLLEQHRWFVMAIAHALELHSTITGEDIDAIFRGSRGPSLDGSVYHSPEFVRFYEAYHQHALDCHQRQAKMTMQLPVFQAAEVVTGSPVYVNVGRPQLPEGGPWSPPVPVPAATPLDVVVADPEP
jgi:cell division protease FtsH